MARLPKQGKILAEEFPEEKFMPKLLSPINDFFADVVSALNKSLTFKENIAGDVITATIDGVYPLDIRWTNKSRPIAAWIGSCREVTGTHTTFTTPLFLDWEMSSMGAFRINKVVGLTATSSVKFTITIVAITG